MPNLKLMNKMTEGQYAICAKQQNGFYKNLCIGTKSECEKAFDDFHFALESTGKVRVSYLRLPGMIHEITYTLEPYKGDVRETV